MSLSFAKSLWLFTVLLAAGFQPLMAETQPVSDVFLKLGEVNTNQVDQLQSGAGPAYVGTWNVELDLGVFEVSPGELGKHGNENRLRDGGIIAGHSLAIESPFVETPIILDLESVHVGLGGVVTYAGTVRGDDGSLVAISVQEDEVLGKIHDSEDYSYIIRKRPALGEETLTIIQHTALPRAVAEEPHHQYDPIAKPDASGRKSFAEDQELTGGGGGTVRVLFMYTPASAARNNVTLVANNLIAQFNQSLNLSNVNPNNSVVLAEIKSIGDNLATYGDRCNAEIVDNMADEIGAFANLSTWMADAFADIGLAYTTAEPSYSECLYKSYGRAGGKATLIPQGQRSNHPDPFATSTDTFALGSLNALHEIGHVLNGRHEIDCGLSEPPQACGYVYDDGVDPDGCVWQTMMGGYITCPFDFSKPPSQQDNPRLARWSNPNVSYGGIPTGTSLANMASALDVNMPYASGWTVNPPPPPSTPNPISSTSWYCKGQNTVSWTAQTNATEYRLYKMGSYPSLLYSGPNTQVNVNVASAGYVAAKACNISGCSAFSDQVYVTWYSICL